MVSFSFYDTSNIQFLKYLHKIFEYIKNNKYLKYEGGKET